MYICFLYTFSLVQNDRKIAFVVMSLCRYVVLSLCRYLFVSRFYSVQSHECYLADFAFAELELIVFGIVATTEDTFFVVGFFEAFYHRALFGVDDIDFAPLNIACLTNASACENITISVLTFSQPDGVSDSFVGVINNLFEISNLVSAYPFSIR